MELIVLISKNNLSINAMGGTELILSRLFNSRLKEKLNKFQIIPSRFRGIEEGKIPIYYCHDLCDDPETEHLYNEGWKKFAKIVFVSYHQRNTYIQKYRIPRNHCLVIKNAIELFDKLNLDRLFKTDEVKLIYTSTPHRGLNILYYAFDNLSKKYPISLDVFSSFKLYGWDERDKPFEELFDLLDKHPKINNHKTVENSVLRDYLIKSHIFAYPSIWEETSCLCLIEAMASGNICVHSSLGALPETAMGTTRMYQREEMDIDHLVEFQNNLEIEIKRILDGYYSEEEILQKVDIINNHYSIDKFLNEWEILLDVLCNKYT